MTMDAFDSRDWTDPTMGGRVTVRMVLFGSDPRAVVPKRGWSVLREKLSRVRAEMRPVAERELAVAVAGLLDVDLGDAIRDGWRSHSRLRAAARATAENPGTTEVVALSNHTITASHTPHVDLVIDDVKVATVEVTVQIVVEIEGLVASVHAGRLVALHNGRSEARVTLLYAGTELATGSITLDVPTSVPLGPGIDLLSRDEPPAYAGERRW